MVRLSMPKLLGPFMMCALLSTGFCMEEKSSNKKSFSLITSARGANHLSGLLPDELENGVSLEEDTKASKEDLNHLVEVVKQLMNDLMKHVEGLGRLGRDRHHLNLVEQQLTVVMNHLVELNLMMMKQQHPELTGGGVKRLMKEHLMMMKVQKKVDEYHDALEKLVQNNLFKKNFLRMQVFAASYLRFTLARVEEDVDLNHGFGNTSEKTTVMVMDIKDRKFVTKADLPSQDKRNSFGQKIFEGEKGDEKYAFSADRSVFQFGATNAADKNPRKEETEAKSERGNAYFAMDSAPLYGKSHGPNLVYANNPYWMNNVFQGTTENKKGKASWPPPDDLMKEVTSHINEVLEWRESNAKPYWDGMTFMAKRKNRVSKVLEVEDGPEKDQLLEFYDLANSPGSGVSQWTMCQGYKIDEGKFHDFMKKAQSDRTAKAAWECIEGASTSVPSIHFQSFLRIDDVKKFAEDDDDVKKFAEDDEDKKTKRLEVLYTVLTKYLIPFVKKFGKDYPNAFIHVKRAKDAYVQEQDETKE